MKKIKNVRTYVAVMFVVLWVGVVVYFASTGEGGLFKGQMYSAPSTCDEILADLNDPEAVSVSAIVDAALVNDCVVPSDLLQKLEPKILEEQKAGL